MTTQTIAYLKSLALNAPTLSRHIPSYEPWARFYELARREVPVLVDEVEKLRAELEELRQNAKDQVFERDLSS